MKTVPFLFAAISLLSFPLSARVLEVGTGKPYATLQSAAAQAQPGDTILLSAAVYNGGTYISDLQGSPGAWITLMGEQIGSVIFRGGTVAFQLTDPAYVRIKALIFESQTGNGVNIDDGGTYDTPAHSLIFEDCQWRALNATGNNDQLKLSGVDTFTVRNCTFSNGSAGGSMVDMVGCHEGTFENNTFSNGGSNCIQAKGGSRFIRIERNRFRDGGERALNIGGSTDAQYFRPPGANYEASDIFVYANVFTGGTTPIAFVGAVNCAVVNNTISQPKKWAFRILQETVGANYLPCGNNAFRNNIVYLGAIAANPTVNIGSNTAPETFVFSNNLWYNFESSSWPGPNLPAAESNGIIGRDPLFVAPGLEDFSLKQNSSAIGKGYDTGDPRFDLLGNRFNTSRSIGAIEGNPVTALDAIPALVKQPGFNIAPNPAHSDCVFDLNGFKGEPVTITIVNTAGVIVFTESVVPVSAAYSFNARKHLPAGNYLVSLRTKSVTAFNRLVVFR